MSKEPLVNRIHASKLLWDLCKIIHYAGFPYRELAQRVKPLVEQHGAKKVSAALVEIATHVGWRTMLNAQARQACFAVLGPAPEQWDWYYTNGLGEPTPRPFEHQTPPVIPPAQFDPFLDSLTRLVWTELEVKLKDARSRNATDDAQAVESEMIRRGMDVPQEQTEAPKPAQEASKGKRTRKKKE